MNKDIVKSQKAVSKAVGVFTKAVSEVESVNKMLSASIESDIKQKASHVAEIERLEKEISTIDATVTEKQKEIENNEQVIATLKQFTKE